MKDYKNFKAPRKTTLKIYFEIFISSLLFTGFSALGWIVLTMGMPNA